MQPPPAHAPAGAPLARAFDALFPKPRPGAAHAAAGDPASAPYPAPWPRGGIEGGGAGEGGHADPAARPEPKPPAGAWPPEGPAAPPAAPAPAPEPAAPFETVRPPLNGTARSPRSQLTHCSRGMASARRACWAGRPPHRPCACGALAWGQAHGTLQLPPVPNVVSEGAAGTLMGTALCSRSFCRKGSRTCSDTRGERTSMGLGAQVRHRQRKAKAAAAQAEPLSAPVAAPSPAPARRAEPPLPPTPDVTMPERAQESRAAPWARPAASARGWAHRLGCAGCERSGARGRVGGPAAACSAPDPRTLRPACIPIVMGVSASACSQCLNVWTLERARRECSTCVLDGVLEQQGIPAGAAQARRCRAPV